MTTDDFRTPAIERRRDFLRMALATPCLLALTGGGLSFAEDVDPNLVEPTAEEALAAIDAMIRTSATNVTSERLDAAHTLQRSVDRLRASEFGTYFKSSPEEAARWENERAILRYLNASFDKAFAEIKETKAEENTVVFWHLYNMGYIVKTPTQTIAVDVKHRRAPELVPYVDYLLVTHNHNDHFTTAFCDAMTAAGKPVVSNFIKNDWIVEEDEREIEIDDSQIRLKRVDHNKTLIKYVTTFEIDCGPKTDHFVIYHVGDACDVSQLTPKAPVDVFIPHLAVGLNVPKAVNETIKPKRTLLSHILELGHLIDKWRWSYDYGYNQVERCANDSVILPVWGEKFVFSRG